MSAPREVWILDCLPPGRPVEARGTSIPFAFHGETMVFATKGDAEKWLSDYGGADGRLWHVATVATEAAPIEVKPATEPELSERIQSLIESRVGEILARAGLKLPADAPTAATTEPSRSSDISQ